MQRATTRAAVRSITFGVILAAAQGAAVAEQFIAGLRPGERPAGAPVLSQPARDANWMRNATAGVSEPLPPTLRFLDDQGSWYTPFTRPGMPGPYDIRGRHPSEINATSPPKPAAR